MTVGDADTPCHPQYFSAVTFEFWRLTEERSHFRVPEFDRRETFMEYLAATTVPRNFTSCVSLFVVAHVHDHTPFPVSVFADTEQYWLMTRLCFDKPLEILLAFLRQRNTCVLCW